ncbi:MAG TPA: DUF975 family protein [Verrucomicrobiae bacterium]
MASYIIIGGDQKEYGPITADDVRQWIAEGRLGAQSMMKAEGEAEWRPLSAFPEFANAFTSRAEAAGTLPAFAGFADGAERDYDLDIGGCVSGGWNLLKNNFGLLFGSFGIYLLIEIAFGVFGKIPFIGILFSIANFFITGPLIGGLYYVYLKAIRNEETGVGEVFAGFKKAFVQLFLGYIVPALLGGLCMVPFLIFFFIKLLPVIPQLPHTSPNDPAAALAAIMPVLKAGFFTSLPVLLICMIPMIYLQISWIFTIPLIIDKQLGFWAAMKTSWKMVNKHWWQVFGLVVVMGLLNIVGVLACCVGLIVTIPLGFVALMYAYETIFSGSQIP